MKQKLIEWLVARFTEKSSAHALAIAIPAGLELHAEMAKVPADLATEGGCIFVLVMCAVAIFTKDGSVLDYIPGNKPK